MQENLEFLNYIYQNAKMGIVGIKNIINKIEQEDFRKVINEQLIDYEDICSNAIKMFIKRNKTEEDISLMAKVMSYIYANRKTSKDNSTSTLAKLMISGSNKGIIEITEKLNNLKNVDKDIYKFGEKLLKIEKRNLENLKKFL